MRRPRDRRWRAALRRGMVWMAGVSLFGHHPLWAGEITLSIPDRQLHALTAQLCIWTSCQADVNGGYKTEAEQLAWITSYFVDEESFGRALWLAGKVVAEKRYAEFFKGSQIVIRFEGEPAP